MIVLKTIDAHAGGEPLRLIVDGFPAPRGRSMAEKREWARQHADHLRRILMLEPRGHADMSGAVLTEPVLPGSHAGLLFMDGDGFSPMSGHAIIAATTIAVERRLLMPGGDGRSVTFDTPAGTIRATADCRADGAGDEDRAGRSGRAGEDSTTSRVERVSFVNVPSFVLHAGVDVALGSRRVRADIAFGGAFYAIVDGESAGLPLDGAHLAELRRAGAEITRAVDAHLVVAHPNDPRLTGLDGTIFTGPSHGFADLRNVTVFGQGQVDRSACGTATAAVMAVVDAMGLLDDERPFVHESIIGTTFSGRLAGRTIVGEYAAIVPAIDGVAWITGEHTFVVDPDDPLRDGFRL